MTNDITLRPISTPRPPSEDSDPESRPVPRGSPLQRFFSRLKSVVEKNFVVLSFMLLYVILVSIVASATKGTYNRGGSHAILNIPRQRDGVALVGYAYRMDLADDTLSIKWELVGCGEYALSTWLPPSQDAVYPDALGCDVCNRAVDVYFNSASEPVLSYDPANIPLSQTGRRRHACLLNSFDVVHGLDFVLPAFVPFDTYSLTAIAFVIEKTTNKSVPIITFAAGEAPDNFIISSNAMPMKNSYTYDDGAGPTTVEVESSVVDITVERSRFAKTFTLWLLFVNFALALGSVYITLRVVARRERFGETVLLLPITIILTIPALRSLYIGSPPLGIFIDTFGFFLQMTTVAVCSITLLYIVAVPSDKKPLPE